MSNSTTNTTSNNATTATANTAPQTVEEFNKKISRTIRFKDRMIYVNDQLKAGKSEDELEMSVFEVELRAKEGNYKTIKREDGKFVKLFSWDLIQRSIDKIKKLRQDKQKLVDLQQAAA